MASSNFYLQIENQLLTVLFNNLSNLYIAGSTDTFNINFPGGNSRIEATDFEANTVTMNTRSSNDIIVNPQEALHGDMYSTGDVIVVNRPVEVTLTAHYQGQLIFRE